MDAGYNVPLTLKKPNAVFEGLRRDEDEDPDGCGWRCYCAVPPYAYRLNGQRIPPWPGEVFLVFVNHDDVAYLWYWDKCDPDGPALPAAHETRFKRRAL